MSGPPVDGRTEQRLREALGALASEVRPAPVEYRRAHAGWRRRERRRRLLLAIVAAVVFAAADVVGLWALNRADPDPHVIFSDHTTSQQQPANPLGQP